MTSTTQNYVVRESYGAKSIETYPLSNSEGLKVIYRRGRSKRVYVRGWYDTMVAMDGLELSLRDFCLGLGITAKDVAAALAEPQP